MFHLGSRFGFGDASTVSNSNTERKDLQLLYWGELMYIVAMATVKFSILLFYRRIFPARSFKIVLWVIAGLVCSWMVAMGLAMIFQCDPIQKAWNPTVAGNCIDLSKLYLGNAVPNIVTDVIIIIVPIPMIWHLQITRSQRVALCGIFLMGGLYVHSRS